MKIDRLVLGAYQNNCYIVRKNEQTKDCLIIDTGLRAKSLITFLKENALRPQALIITHGHADHIAGIAPLKENFPQIKVCIYRDDAHMLSCPQSNLSALTWMEVTSKPADIIFDREEDVEFANIKLRIIHTPGHSPGGICLYNSDEKVLFSGDTLFAGSIGRTDFPGFDAQKCQEQLIANIRNKLLILPDDTTVLSGHGETTTIKQEKLHNPFLS